MSAARIAFALVAALALAACNQDKEPTYQGWIEAELIFVGPDEMGRIERLRTTVRLPKDFVSPSTSMAISGVFVAVAFAAVSVTGFVPA